MSHSRPDISRREMKNKGFLDTKKFYEDVAAECGYIDTATAERFYKAVVRVVVRNLTKNRVSRMPFIGDFFMVRWGERKGLVGTDGFGRPVTSHIPERMIVKFVMQDRLREYFSKKFTSG